MRWIIMLFIYDVFSFKGLEFYENLHTLLYLLALQNFYYEVWSQLFGWDLQLKEMMFIVVAVARIKWETQRSNFSI